MAGEGAGTSLYMMALLKDTHHDPKFGPFEAKKYEGQNQMPHLTIPALHNLSSDYSNPACRGSYRSLDLFLSNGKHDSITYTSRDDRTKYVNRDLLDYLH